MTTDEDLNRALVRIATDARLRAAALEGLVLAMAIGIPRDEMAETERNLLDEVLG